MKIYDPYRQILKRNTQHAKDFIKYFQKHELKKFKESISKCTKSILKMKEHRQNPIEQLTFLAKDEINTDAGPSRTKEPPYGLA